MSLEQVNNFRIQFKSVNSFIDFTGQAPDLYNKVIIESSVFDFFPYCEMNIQDKTGIFINNAYFIEGLEFEVFIEDIRTNERSGHTFVWSENQMLDTKMTTESVIAGDNLFILISKFEFLNKKKRKMYLGKISDIVRDIVTSEFKIEASKIFIDDTVGNFSETRNNETASEFIQRLATYSYNQSSTKSPYLTYINGKGEFYFKTLDNLYRTNKPIKNLKINFDPNMAIDENNVKEYTVLSGGMPANQDNYRIEQTYLDQAGDLFSEETKIEEFFITDKNKSSRFPIVKSIIGEEIRDQDFFGLYIESEDDRYYYKGYKNNMYLSSLMSHRLELTVDHDSVYAIGEKIHLTVNGNLEESELSPLFSGEWLILDEKDYIDGDLQPYNLITVAKCGVTLNDNNKFKKDFINV